MSETCICLSHLVGMGLSATNAERVTDELESLRAMVPSTHSPNSVPYLIAACNGWGDVETCIQCGDPRPTKRGVVLMAKYGLGGAAWCDAEACVVDMVYSRAFVEEVPNA